MSAPYRQRWGFVLLYMVFLFQVNLLFSKINTCRGMAKETLKKIVSLEGKAILTFTMCLGGWGFLFNEKTTLFRVVFVF